MNLDNGFMVETMQKDIDSKALTNQRRLRGMLLTSLKLFTE